MFFLVVVGAIAYLILGKQNSSPTKDSWVLLLQDLSSSIEIYYPISYKYSDFGDVSPCTNSRRFALSFPKAPSSLQDPDADVLTIVEVASIPDSVNCPLRSIEEILETNSQAIFDSNKLIEIKGNKFVRSASDNANNYYVIHGDTEYQFSHRFTQDEGKINSSQRSNFQATFEEFIQRLVLK